MDTRTIGSLTVSVVGLGCNNFGMRIGSKETDAVVGAALAAGITLFDTADIYGGTKSEEFLGAALGSRRDEIVLATKFGAPYEDHTGGAAPAHIRVALEDSLRRLGTDHVDLYQLHIPDKNTPIAETLGTLAELVAEGKVREFGCSNFDGAMLEDARAAVADGSPGFVSVQNQYNVLYREPEDEVLPFCDRTGTAFLPFFPLASGLLSGKYRAGEEAPEGTRMAAWGERAKNELTDERLAKVAALDALAKSEGHTVLELAFAWLLSHSAVASVIAGATKPEQIAANAAAGAWTLDTGILAQIDTIAPR
jgi:aryl-alcohol dehydrogenase-like predicted oxidoreductase